MQIQNPWQRLQRGNYWRLVDRDHNRIIARQLSGCRDVLDVGCGYGSLTRYLQGRGFQVTGADVDEDALELARSLSPGVDPHVFRMMSGDRLDFADGRFDAVVLRDTLHHLHGEADLDRAMKDHDQALKLDPKNALAFNNRGIAKLKKGDKEGGEADIAKAKQLQPGIGAPQSVDDSAPVKALPPHGAE